MSDLAEDVGHMSTRVCWNTARCTTTTWSTTLVLLIFKARRLRQAPEFRWFYPSTITGAAIRVKHNSTANADALQEGIKCKVQK